MKRGREVQEITLRLPSLPHCNRKMRDLPDLSSCHRCGVRHPSKGARGRLRFLRSNWRIALLCEACLAAVASAEACSYCFSRFAGGDSFDCRRCRRRVHRGCVPEHHRHIPPPGFDRDPFACIDCCPYVKPRGSTGPKVSLENVVRDAGSVAEKKAAAAARAKENALRKAAAANRATQLARSALDAVLAVKKTAAKADEAVPDEKLALELHRAMNCSQRISRSQGSWNSDRSSGLKKVQGSESYSICGNVEVCTEDKSFFEIMGRTGSPQVEEQGSCAQKVENSGGDVNGIGSASVSGRRPDEGNDSQKKERNGAPDRYSKKYSRNSWRLKGAMDLECWIVPCRQMSCSEVSKLCSDAHCQPH